MASFLSDIANKKQLRKVAAEEKDDRSAANVALAGKDVLDDEAERWTCTCLSSHVALF
jgi:hypothetical protein